MSAISASFRGLSQQSHLLRGWSFTPSILLLADLLVLESVCEYIKWGTPIGFSARKNPQLANRATNRSAPAPG